MLKFRSSLTIVLILTLCTGNLAQQKDEKGRKQGYWKKYDEKTNKLIYEGQFKDDQPIGVFKYYHFNDSIKAIIDFKADGKTAYAQLYHYNGKLSAKGKYAGSEVKDSVWTFYDEMGTLISRENYKSGKKQGLSLVYLPDGSVSEEKSYKEGLEDGLFLQYFEKNKLKTRGQYLKGKREGRFIYYYPNGVEVANGFFKNDLKNGPWIYKNPDGKIKEKELYKNGNLATARETEVFFSKNKGTESSAQQPQKTPKPAPNKAPSKK